MKFIIVGNSLIYIDEGNKIIEGENEYALIEIETKRYRNKLDLMSLSFRLTAISVADSTKSACQVLFKSEIDENTICLKGEINSDFSAITGKVVFMLTGVNSDEIVAKFDSRPITITDDISLDSMPTETAAEQLFNQAQLEAQKAMDAAAETQEMLDNFTLSPATEAKLGGVIVDGTSIIADENGVISVVGGINGSGEIILPKATTETLGGIKVDGGTIIVNSDGVISTSENIARQSDITSAINEIKSYLGYTDSDIIGLHADFENSIFTRLGAAVGLNAGSDFDQFSMYGGRKRCNVLDDGAITAYYGDSNFVEDGSNGQVMVYQPKFYYKVVPLKLDPITDGCGYHLRKANYYISETPKEGFKLHPVFYDENGNPVDYILFSAYEGSIYDSSENVYLQNDEQVADFTADKLSSIANVKPCSGAAQSLTRANAELLAKNRGTGWHIDTVKEISANQLLMAVEYCSFNMQEVIGQGIVNKDISEYNNSECTGMTSSIGDDSGISNGTTGLVSVTYRGMENPWGNIFKYANGINVYISDNKMVHAFICSDYNFEEKKGTENYKNVGFSLSNTKGYIKAFGYSDEFDWIFIASDTGESGMSPIGDCHLIWTADMPGWYVYRISGYWADNMDAGAFFTCISDPSYFYHSTIGARIIYVPVSKIL